VKERKRLSQNDTIAIVIRDGKQIPAANPNLDDVLQRIAPDILSVSKTLGGGIPIAATLTSSAIEEDCYSKGFMHVTSHVSDPLPAAVGLAVINVIEEEGLVEQARLRGEYLMARLRELQQHHEQIGDVRGKGLLVGVELVKDRIMKEPADALGAAVSDECLQRGLSMNIVRSTGWMPNYATPCICLISKFHQVPPTSRFVVVSHDPQLWQRWP